MSESLYSISSEYKDFNPNNMVCLFKWEGDLDLLNMFNSLPITVLDILPTIKGKKCKMKYYGIDQTIVNIRFKKKSRGIRPLLETSDNFVSIDLQNNGKNIHIKFSVNNALVLGSKSFEEATDAIKTCFEIMKMSDNNLTKIRKTNKKDIDNIMNFIINLSENNKKSLNLPMVKDFQELLDLENSKLDNDNYIDVNKCLIFLAYAYECKTINQFKFTIKNLQNCTNINPDMLEMGYCDVKNSGYSYKIINDDCDGVFILQKLAHAIIKLDLDQVSASHHNWHSKYVNVVINNDTLDDNGEIVRHTHRFNISEKGSVRQWSPSFKEEAFEVKNLLLCIIQNSMRKMDGIFIKV